MAKPSTHLDWTDGDASKVVEPSAAKKLLGWVALERPPFEYMNFLFFRTDEWLKYFESTTDTLLAGNTGYDAVVGASGTHGTLNDAVAAVTPPARIFVLDPLTLTSTQIINKEDILVEFSPKAVYSKGASLVTGLEIDAARVTLFGARFLNFNEVGGRAVEMTANAQACMVYNNRFNNNTSPIVDNGSNNQLYGNIVE